MPNYHIPGNLRLTLQKRVANLAQRTLDYALADFPMTTAQVQYAILPAAQVDDLRRLDAEGIRTIEHHRQVRLAFLREQTLGLRRGVVIALELPEWIVVGRGTQWSISTTRFQMDENHYLMPELWIDSIDDAQRKSITLWLERVVRQTRMVEITNWCASGILNDHGISKTASHLHAVWPMLTTIVDDNMIREEIYTSQHGYYRDWQKRFRNPTRSLKAYRPDASVVEKYGRLIEKVADTVINAGQILEPYRHPNSTILAKVEHWERLPADLVLDS
jgi:hypothetical protein